ncbi:MAG: DUF1538 domain-containing protein [Methanomassiliicoccales archaeon]|nr:DUF1538 domain-containing protein [Methanomassiliicoccales archaeon]
MTATGTVDIFSVVLDVAQAVLPIIVFFLVFQSLYIKYPWPTLKRLLLGIAITGAGMVLFLSGVFVGFLPVGREIGEHVALNNERWVLLALGFVMGFLATFAEPAVRVLAYQVETTSSGFIGSKLLLWTLSLGVAAFVSLGMAKIVYDFDFKTIIIAGYVLALVLMVFCDKDFVAIAFDAGGVATGPMAVSLLMSMAVGVASATEGSDAVIDGFGLIALIALAPILFLSALGVIMRYKRKVEI